MTPTAQREKLKNQVRELLVQHYTSYYRDQLGLPDWRQKVESRLDEENVYAKRV